MRLFLLPVSTRRTLIFCQRLNVASIEQKSWLDKGTQRAASLWASWEKKESGWQRKVVDYGNHALKRIPYEEWGLKSIPPLSTRRKEEAKSGVEIVEVSFPSSLIPEDKVLEVLRTLGAERQGLHKQRLIYSFIGMPLVAPFALIPVIPNLPFFYLVFRAWSHWRALSGGKHLQFLVEKNLVNPKPSSILNELYSTGKYQYNSAASPHAKVPGQESMVLHNSDGKRISEVLEIPELCVELDRAVWQVEKALGAEKEHREEEAKLHALEALKKK